MRSAIIGPPLLLALALLIGCGGGGGSTSTSSTSATGASVGTTAPESSGQSTPAPDAQPTSESGVQATQAYRPDARAADRAKAASTVSAYFKAQASRSWGKACSYLSASLRRNLEGASRGSNLPAGKGCGGLLVAFLGKQTPAALRSAAEVHRVSLRVNGSQAVLTYRDSGGTSHYIPLLREGAGWKVNFPIGSGSTSPKAK